MKTYERKGITYRLLEHGEKLEATDLVAYRNCIQRDKHWVPVQRLLFSSLSDRSSIPKNFAFLRECDPLIAEMIKAKRKSKK